jgi:hypothetical protein
MKHTKKEVERMNEFVQESGMDDDDYNDTHAARPQL